MEESSKASRRLGITEDSVASNEDEVRESNEQAEDVNFTPGFMLPEVGFKNELHLTVTHV